MKEETQRWINKSKEDLKAAQINYKNKLHSYAAFLCQQAVEKVLKAMLLETTGQFPKIHDLVRLGRLVGLDEKLLKECDRLTFVYVETRYPDTGNRKYTKKETRKDILSARRVVLWATKKLS